MTTTFGIFDSFDQGARPPGQVVRERLDFAVAAEQAGIDHYHVTEHHGTPLSVCPSPNIFLAALAQRTHRMRIGALVYVLPIYHPLRLAEEIATLDQLTGGRIDMGVGRGVSPYELGYFDVAAEDSLPRYIETSKTLLETFTTGVYRIDGDEAHLSITPVQRPYPAMWYASSTANSAEWAGANAVNFAGRWNDGQFAEVAAAYWREWTKAHEGEAPPRVGTSASVVVGETDEEARALFAEAGTEFTNDLLKLWREHDNHNLDAVYNLGNMIEKGNALVGSVETVTERILEQLNTAEMNYVEANLFFGTMTEQQAHDNLGRFAQVMQNVRAAAPSEQGRATIAGSGA